MTSRDGEMNVSMLSDQHNRQQTATLSALNAEQETVLDTLDSVDPPQLVNIYGPPGAGKTFFSWTLARSEESWSYHPWIPTTSVEASKVIVDNVAPQRVASRRVRELINFDEVKLAVALSRKPIPEIHGDNLIQLNPDQ